MPEQMEYWWSQEQQAWLVADMTTGDLVDVVAFDSPIKGLVAVRKAWPGASHCKEMSGV